MKGTLYILSAPSGAGKSSLVEAAVTHLQAILPIKRGITYTTKAPGQGEAHGRDYFFISPEVFETYIRGGFFLEYSRIHGNYYGTPLSILNELEKGTSLFLITDLTGAQALKQRDLPVVLIWVTVTNVQELTRRLYVRGRDSSTIIKQRIQHALKEMEEVHKIRFFDYSIDNSGSFERACNDLVAVVKKNSGFE